VVVVVGGLVHVRGARVEGADSDVSKDVACRPGDALDIDNVPVKVSQTDRGLTWTGRGLMGACCQVVKKMERGGPTAGIGGLYRMWLWP
jgi:hypothetical protein